MGLSKPFGFILTLFPFALLGDKNGKELIEEAGAPPFEVVAMTGGVLGVVRRQFRPRGIGEELVQDAFEDRVQVGSRVAARSGGAPSKSATRSMPMAKPIPGSAGPSSDSLRPS